MNKYPAIATRAGHVDSSKLIQSESSIKGNDLSHRTWFYSSIESIQPFPLKVALSMRIIVFFLNLKAMKCSIGGITAFETCRSIPSIVANGNEIGLVEKISNYLQCDAELATFSPLSQRGIFELYTSFTFLWRYEGYWNTRSLNRISRVFDFARL